jgi:hypothetical protein
MMAGATKDEKFGKHASTAMGKHGKTEELFDAVFSVFMRSVPRLSKAVFRLIGFKEFQQLVHGYPS